jgi:hypothetical protein
MSNILKINNFRINVSSFSKNYKYKKNDNSKYIYNNKKVININNFEININNKIIKYSLFYTNPNYLKNKIIKNINFNKNKNPIIKNFCQKIFLTKNYELTNLDQNDFTNFIIKKNKINSKYIELEHSFLILWYIIYSDINIINKEIYYDLIKFYYGKYILNKFDCNEIIYNMLNNNNIEYKKFYLTFYVLMEEFHFKYITFWLKETYKNNIYILNSNYIKINPQTILNNSNSLFNYDLNDLNDYINNPFGHNILFLLNSNKIYYYDSDELLLSDLYKFKSLFKNSQINFYNISNRNPIQTNTNDANCVFYCLGLVEYINKNNITININNLKLAVLLYENNLLSKKNKIYNWIYHFI